MKQGTTNDKKHEVGSVIAIGAWIAIASIPVGIILLVLVILVRTPHNGGRVALPVAFVCAIATAAIYILCDHIGRHRWKLRSGHACVDCGYDMRADLYGRCPECGLECAAQRRYAGTWFKRRCDPRDFYRVRQERVADRGTLGPTWHVNVAAFARESEAKLIESLRSEIGDERLISLVAVVSGGGGSGEEVVGHILLTPITIEPDAGAQADARMIDAIALAPMAVRPHLQRQGIGSLLIRAAIEAARSAGHQRMIVLGHADYYPRFGFERASVHGIRAPFDVPDEAWMAIALAPGGLDQCAGTVRYPRAFLDV